MALTGPMRSSGLPVSSSNRRDMYRVPSGSRGSFERPVIIGKAADLRFQGAELGKFDAIWVTARIDDGNVVTDDVHWIGAAAVLL